MKRKEDTAIAEFENKVKRAVGYLSPTSMDLEEIMQAARNLFLKARTGDLFEDCKECKEALEEVIKEGERKKTASAIKASYESGRNSALAEIESLKLELATKRLAIQAADKKIREWQKECINRDAEIDRLTKEQVC